jgi:preprotein translocase subunit SecD
MRKATGPWLVVIAAITILSLYMILPNGGLFGRPIEVRPGLDIQGGLRVLMAAEGTNITADQMDQVRQVIDRRVNALGVVEQPDYRRTARYSRPGRGDQYYQADGAAGICRFR